MVATVDASQAAGSDLFPGRTGCGGTSGDGGGGGDRVGNFVRIGLITSLFMIYLP